MAPDEKRPDDAVVTAPVEPAQSEPRRRRSPWWLPLALPALTVLVFAVAAWVGLDALRARSSLEAAASEVTALEDLALSGDLTALDDALVSLQAHTGNAHRATTGPHWWLAAHVPGIGPSVTAVQTVAAVVDDLATDALPALSEAAAVVDPAALAPTDGRIDLRPLIDVAPTVVAADVAVQDAAARLGQVDTSAVFEQVAGPVEDLRALVADVAMTTGTASRAVRLLPPMLGADGPRQYLLLAQSPAEIRSGGGFIGALVLLTTDEGAVSMVGQQTAGSFGRFEDPVLPLTADEEAIYQSRMARYIGNVTMTPDFPRSAELASAMWAARGGGRLDGVLAVDPVVLQYLLAATGPVRTSTGHELTADNAARFLLNEVYRSVVDPSEQDAIFADAARAVFGALTSGQGDPTSAVGALADAAAEGRVLAWSANPAEQDLLAGTVLSGELRGEAGGAPVVGVYLNDATGAKASYYLDYSVRVERSACLADGGRELEVALDLSSTAPDDVADLPPYISGGNYERPVGVVWTNVAFYGPRGGSIVGATVGGDPAGVGAFEHEGLPVAIRTVKLSPGESQTIRVKIITGNDQPEPVQVRVTPGSNTPMVAVSDYPCTV